jgi:hypothetical protein
LFATTDQQVRGSSPLARTTFSNEFGGLLDSRTDSAQILAESEPPKMKFPKFIRHRKAEVNYCGGYAIKPICHATPRLSIFSN